MNRKLGPLKLWQWVLIGAAGGLAAYLYRRSRGAAAPSVPGPADAAAALQPTQGVIDPTTGAGSGNPGLDATGDPTVPVPLSELLGLAQQSSNGATGGDSASQQVNAPTLDSELSNVGTILDLLDHWQTLMQPPQQTTTGTNTTSVNTGQQRPPKPPNPPGGGHYTYVNGRGWVLIHWDASKAKWVEGAVPPKKPPKKKKQSKPPSNPGHTVTHHGGGRHTASSSAPHNPRQHQNVQPPNHQRHHPTRARRPTGGAGLAPRRY